MEGYEDEDDTHFCIKCHLTIHGLENYVRHRQSGCRASGDKAEGVRVSPSTPTTVSYPEILNADAFFNSLELQSSSKSNTRRSSNLLEESRRLKRDERKKKSLKSQSQVDTEETTGKDKLHNMLPGVTDLDDPTEHLCIPSLVGFPDIVSSTSSKPSNTTVQNKTPQSISHSSTTEESTSFSTKHEREISLESSLMTESKQQGERKRTEDSHQRIEHVHQNWLDDTILADFVGNPENKELSRYEFEYQQEEDSEEDMLEEELGDEDSYSESDEGEDRERPPRGHTGGKWKPGSEDPILPQNMSQLQEEDVEPEEEHQEHPPPSYTGGKWKPAVETSQVKEDKQQLLLQKIEEYEAKDTAAGGQPPPGHTRGKWVPGARTDIESGYWCSPCGRKLASRLVYNRHLLSDLHARRSFREIEGTLHLPRTAEPTTRGRAKKRNQKFRETLDDLEETKKNSLRRREKEVLSCEMCHARVRRTQMGKHLLSHYHCRVAGVNPRGPRARRFLLENMGNVVRQCPFQCSSCRFYCNTEETFLRHWRSDVHTKTLQQQIGGNYRCTPCDYWCENNETMELHLLSSNHRDFIALMNGTVPMVIAYQHPLPCASCDRRFRYNIQLRLHAKETGHTESLTASDEYQQRIKCDACPQILRSLLSLQRHQLSCHSSGKEQVTGKNDSIVKSEVLNPYFCSFCSLNFASAQEAVLHRRTSKHKETVKARKASGEPSTSTSRECPHCEETQSNLSEHKEHLLRSHPELCHRCPRCGTIFALSQDVTRHTRENECRTDKKLNVLKPSVVKEEWKCSSCTFSTDSEAEFIFHEVLHTGTIESEEPSCSKFPAKYSCPICKKSFTKVTLRNHIRSHTGERPFPCSKCFVSFSRRSDLKAHQRECEPAATSRLATAAPWPEENQRKRNFCCSECNSGFYTKHALRQHMLRHAGKKYKCGLPGCPTVLRTASELKTHRALVHESSPSEGRRFPCTNCSYAAKTKIQLRRHRARHEESEEATVKSQMLSCSYAGCSFRTKLSSHLRRHARLHTGTKPYKCRHCIYASNNLENLRKHVLSTNLHPGKTIYECDFCKGKTSEVFQTNFAKELRAHLSTAHSSVFPTPASASDYVLGIFGSHQETSPAEQPT